MSKQEDSAESRATEQVVDGLWSRFRDIALALRRLQDFNFSADGAEGRFTDRWLEGLVSDEVTLAGTSRELVLRAVRVGAEDVNFRILARIAREGEVTLSRLAEATGLSHLALSERVNDLAQVGLAARVLERDAVGATSLSHGFLAIVENIEGRLTARIRERLPGLIAP